MEEDIYHIGDIIKFLGSLNPHLELKEHVKNIGDFTIDLVLSLAGYQTYVKIPMDTFRNYTRQDRTKLENLIKDGYARLLTNLEAAE